MFAALATAEFWKMMAFGLWETFYMVTVSVLLAYLIGLPLGLILAALLYISFKPMKSGEPT